MRIEPRAGWQAGASGLTARVALVLTVTAAAMAATAGAPAPVAAAGLSAPADQGCTDNVGVTVVVDFHELGGGVQARCATGSVATGFDALTSAGITYQNAIRVPGFLCRVAGQPADDPCQNTSPASAYWSYWIAPRGGTWCASSVGAGNRTPPPGSLEGWSFAKDKATSAIPPPGYAVPAPVPGAAPHPLAPGDCATTATTTTIAPPPPPPAPPVTAPPPTSGSGSAAGAGSAGAPRATGSGTTGGGGAAGSGVGAGSGSGSATGAGAGPSGPVSGNAGPTVPGSPGGSPSASGSVSGPEEPTNPNAPAPSSAADSPGTSTVGVADAAGTPTGSTPVTTSSDATETAAAIDLGAKTTSSGSPVPLLLTVVLAGVLGGSAVWTSRRRRSSGSD